jgi:hypothetical protein
MLRQYKIPAELGREVFTDAMRLANHINTDELPPGTVIRKHSDKGIGWVLDFILNTHSPFLSCIERPSFGDSPPYIEFTMSTSASVTEYFLWVHVPTDAALTLIEKYQLINCA